MSTVSLVNETQFHVVAVGPVQMANGGSSGELFILAGQTGLNIQASFIGIGGIPRKEVSFDEGFRATAY